MRALVVGMPGDGNLGDDLISALLVRRVAERWPEAEIGVLHGPLDHPFSYPASARPLLRPVRGDWRRYSERRREITRFAAGADLVLIGGGGLFQDAYSPFTIHRWLKYAYEARRPCAVWAVGVGFGILRTAFARAYLRHTIKRLSVIQVRDRGSREVAERFCGVPEGDPRILLAPDIVAGTPLYEMIAGSGETDERELGCSFRPWPGLRFEQVVSLVTDVCRRYELRASLFVFEHADAFSPEYDFACRVARSLTENGTENRIVCYRKDDWQSFTAAFRAASRAIASRYHANILWQKLGTSVLPIAYYPKVERLYVERGGFALPVDDLSLPEVGDPFQRLCLEEDYRLPEADPSEQAAPVGARQRWLIRAVSAGDAAHALAGGVLRRLGAG
jgi:polysaccharide pyruvyl transferase WcaK-like protein